jgi:hypothetical protein
VNIIAQYLAQPEEMLKQLTSFVKNMKAATQR